MIGAGSLVYVVDDDASAREGVARLIRSAGLMTKTFASGEEFLAAPRPKIPSCLVLDVNLPGLSGLDVQQELAKSGTPIPVIFLTGHGDIPMTVRAVKAGAVDFLTKPFDEDDLLNAVRLCMSFDRQQEIRNETSFGPIVGNSPALRQVLKLVQTVAPTDSTVLVLGETGTGKELIARAIHDRSARQSGAFVKLNCAAIPSDLLESELFGHEKGAFTGAIAQKLGRFDLADKGTLFLDEVGDIPPALQPKLLRVLQEQEFERLGSTQTRKVNARLIAATNRDLAQMVANGKFREDLYYRLAVFPIQVPPLRKRKDDILMLVDYFVKHYANRTGKNIRSIDQKTLELLQSYDWPGNVRELQNVVERSVILTSGDVLSVDESWLPEVSSQPSPGTQASCPLGGEEREESEIIQAALAECRGRVWGAEGAAAKLGIPPSTLDYKIKSLKIRKTQFRFHLS